MNPTQPLDKLNMKSIVLVCRVLFFIIIAAPFLIISRNGYSFEPQPKIAGIYSTARGITASNGDKIVGIWLTHKGDSKIQIVKSADGGYSGKLVWVESPNEEFTGMNILKEVTYNPDSDNYDCPWVYDPKLKIAARATARVSNDTLYLKARKGIVSMNEIFTRVDTQ